MTAKTLKDRLWMDYRIACRDASWGNRGAYVTKDSPMSIDEWATRIADATGCDVIHLSDTEVLIEGLN